MPIIKETIKSNGEDTTIKFGLGNNNKLSGYQQEIDELTEETKDDLINPIVDNEVRRFQYDSSFAGPTNLVFFFTANGSSYYNKFTPNAARFSTTEITENSNKILNSFFIMDCYDTFNNNTQTKLFTIYQTQILDGEIGTTLPIPKYRIYSDTVNQFYNWYVPKSYLDKQSGLTVTAYVKFSFYNAKYGDLALFYNKDNDGLTTPEKMYFEVLLDLNKMTWRFDYGGGSGDLYPPDATAYQIPFNNVYSQRVNEALDNFDNQQQDYPDGNVFDSEDGTYSTT